MAESVTEKGISSRKATPANCLPYVPTIRTYLRYLVSRDMQALFVALPQLHLLWSFACRGAFVPLPAVSRSATDNGLIRVQLQIETRGRSLLLTSLHHSTPCRQHAGFIFLKRVGKGILRSSIPSPKKDTEVGIHAMKVISRKVMVRKEEVAHIMGQRNVLVRAATSKSPFLAEM